MERILVFILIFISTQNLIGQNAEKNAVGVTFMQFQPRYWLGGVKFDQFSNIGISIEHKLWKNSSLFIESLYRSGLNRVPCIDCPGASGTMYEFNTKFGAIRYWGITDKWNIFGRLNLFYERMKVPHGKANWSVVGDIYQGWYREVKFYGLELAFGAEIKLVERFYLFINPSFQLGKYQEENSFSRDRDRLNINFAYLENVGIKYKF